MSRLKRVCVYCGSQTGRDPLFAEMARQLGRTLAGRGLGLVYGAGGIGLMGALADAVLEAGGEAIGVIPRPLASKEVAHARLSRLHLVDTMHERKALMADLSDAFVALPGGFGTFEELFETITWAQLGIHRKPIGLLDAGGYFGPFSALVNRAARDGFIRSRYLDLIVLASSPEDLLDRLQTHTLPPTRTWLRPEQA